MVFGNMGDDVGNRRRLHAQSIDRRERALRRVPRQCAGRGRRRRHPHAAAAHRGGAQASRRERALARGADAGDVRRADAASCARSSSTTATCRTSSSRSRKGNLWMLQTRSGKRTGRRRGPHRRRHGGGRHADHREEARPAHRAARARPAPASDLRSRRRGATVIATGLPRIARAPPPARSCSTPTRPSAEGAKGAKVILVRIETTPEDIHGMHAAAGILTARGGMTSHAAVVARGMGQARASSAAARSRSTTTSRHHDGRRRTARSEGRRHHHRRLDRRGHRRVAVPHARSRSSRGDFGNAS